MLWKELISYGNNKGKTRNWRNIKEEITAYHQLNYYKDSDLHDIADGTSREEEINDYIYEQNYGTDKDYDNYDIDI